MAALPSLDGSYADRVRDARSNGQVLRYVARIAPDGGQVGLLTVPQKGWWGALRGAANYVAFYSDRYAEVPLVISGPGAGPEVTAAGLLGDVIDLVLQRVSRG